ncbi:MAG: hypothetical protein ACP5OG_04120 [Candidatus Nanoarchaeia archaeon]
MNNKLYFAVAEKYLQKYQELKNYSKGDSKFRDVGANLLVSLEGCAYALQKWELNNETFKEKRKKFILNLKSIKNYFNLIDKFPEFKNGELNNEDGYFPELYYYSLTKGAVKEQEKLFGGINTIKHYVLLSKTRLEKTASVND